MNHNILLGIFQKRLALHDQFFDHNPLGLKLIQGLLLPLNELIHILDTGWGDVTGGGKHDTIQELNMGLQLVTVGVALPVEVHHDGGLLDVGDELLVLEDELVQLVMFVLPLVLGTLGH